MGALPVAWQLAGERCRFMTAHENYKEKAASPMSDTAFFCDVIEKPTLQGAQSLSVRVTVVLKRS
jgi:hypothetical protein